MQADDFSGHSALITGAASGIGAATARWLDARNIGRLALVDRNAEGLDKLELGCVSQRHIGDVSDPEFWSGIARDIGSIQMAIACAGVADGAPIAEMSFDDWRSVLSVNLDGAFLTLQATMRAMTAGGSIVMLASATGIKPAAGASAYGASKAAVIHLAKTAALEGVKTGIRVNVIAPGGVDTPIWDNSPAFSNLAAEIGREQAIAAMASATPNGRFATAREIAESIGFLLSERSANITGAVLTSDGGYSIS